MIKQPTSVYVLYMSILFSQSVSHPFSPSALIFIFCLHLYSLWALTPSLHLCVVTQSCLILCDPMDCARLLCPWDFSGKNTGVG